MALAIIELDGVEGGRYAFRGEIGTNRYWSLSVGDGREPDVEDGFKVLSEVTHRTRVTGPLPPYARGRTRLEVPAAFFDGDHRHVQLLSFREADLTGRAMSEILAVAPGGDAGSDGLDPIAFGMSGQAALDVVPFRPARARPMSTAMFLDVLAGLARQVLPVIAPLLGNLIDGRGGAPAASPPAGGAPATGGAAAGTPAQGATTPTAQLIVDLVNRLLGPAAAAGGTAAPAAPQGRAQALDLPPDAHFSQAQIAPALLAALPALMPLLQQVLSPETIKNVLQTADPNRLISTITDGLAKLGGLGLQGQKQEMEHLERINPGTATPDLIQLMEGMGLSSELAVHASRLSPPRYRRVEQVELAFAEIAPLELDGREQACVLAGRELAFPLTLDTPRPLPRATLRLRVKSADTLRPVCSATWPVDGAGTGRLPVVPMLTREKANKLEPGHEYLVEAELTWKGRGRRLLGTSRTQLVTVVGPLVFGGIEQTTEVIPLNDVEAHREFWHKAWQGTFSAEMRKVVFNVRYHYGLDPRARRNAQMETVSDTEPASVRHEVGRLGSGLMLAPPALNTLLRRLGRPVLGDAELQALASPDAAKRFAVAARTKVSLRGRVGDSAALWVYPEVKLQTLILQAAADISDAGHVLRFDERRVSVPVPVLAHVIGVVSE